MTTTARKYLARRSRPRTAPRSLRPPPRKLSSGKESERKKRELITMGKAKGFLTYDEVNEHMPENIVSSDQMDDWLSAFSGEGIEIVDSSSKVKVGAQGRRRRGRGRRRRRDRGGRGQEGRGRGGGRLRRLLQDQRPGAHVPAQDGLGLAAHARGRGRDRQAHRGRRAARASGRAQLARSRSRRSCELATSCGSRRSASRTSSRTPTRKTPSSTSSGTSSASAR